MTLKRNSKAMSVISKQFELIEMSISTNKHYSDDAVRGWREGRRAREGRLRGEINGEKCVRDCV